MRYRLSRDVTVIFRGEYEVSAPAGTFLTVHNDGMGNPRYAIPQYACTPEYPSLFAHDAIYFYVWAPENSVEVYE